MPFRILSPQWHKQRRRRRRRVRQGAVLAKNLKKRAAQFDPNVPFRFIGDTKSINGLSRAYRYETARRANPCELQGASERAQVLILGQPWDYPRLLTQTPPWFTEAYRIGLWVWELDQFPRDWQFALDIVHEIWTPSSFSAGALSRGTEIPIRVVPHAVRIPEGSPLPRTRFGVRDDQFLGMAIMDLGTCPDRKNPVAHVKAWLRAFGGDIDAHLLMKVRFKKTTRFMRNALIKSIGDAANITLIEETFGDDEMTSFQRMADVYLSLHRAEGYGLNIHEMLEIGTPTLATGWSGNMEYMARYPHAVAVPYRLIPYEDRTFAYEGNNLEWAEPDIDFTAMALRNIRANWRRARTSRIDRARRRTHC